MDTIKTQYKQIRSKSGVKHKRIQAIISDEYDEVLRDLDRLQDYKYIQWQIGLPTWAVVHKDIVPQKSSSDGK